MSNTAKSHNEELLNKFKARAACHYIMNKTEIKTAAGLSEFFEQLRLGDDQAWQKLTRGEGSFSETKLSIIENAYKNPMLTDMNSKKLGKISKQQLISLYEKVSGVRKILDIGPVVYETYNVPFWKSLTEQVTDFSEIMAQFKKSLPWPEEVYIEPQKSYNRNEKVIKENPESSIDNIPKDCLPIHDLAAICLKLNLNLPKMHNWHQLTLLIILYRHTVEFERSELLKTLNQINWIDCDNIHTDEIFEHNHVNEEDCLQEIEDIITLNAPLALTPINLNALKTKIINKLKNMENDLIIYGLTPKEIDFYLKQLYLNFSFKNITFKKLSNFPSKL